jgi:ABC-2 type transport system ATP-binding protein
MAAHGGHVVTSVNAIEIRAVSKSFNAVQAVDDLTLTVPAGSTYGFIGPNGSGKTTTLRMILNILLPDAGAIAVFGQTGTTASRDRVGYLPEERGLYKRMKLRGLLQYFGRLKGQSGADLNAFIDQWLKRFDLTAWAEKPINTLSKGMSQKAQFIAAIVGRPDLLILDEPFSGLDPINAEVLKDAVLELKRSGTTIVFSTHDMATAEKMCDRIFMIFRGHKVLDGSLDDIQATYGFDTVRVRTAGGAAVLAGMPGVASINDYGRMQDVRLTGDAQQFLVGLAERTPVHYFEIVRPSLHDIFVRIATPGGDHATVE